MKPVDVKEAVKYIKQSGDARMMAVLCSVYALPDKEFKELTKGLKKGHDAVKKIRSEMGYPPVKAIERKWPVLSQKL